MNNIIKILFEEYNLNIYYPSNSTNIEKETNLYIQELFNYFSTLNTNNIYILKYNDDIISLLSYQILNLVSKVSHFTFYTHGKVKKTKEYIKNFSSISSLRIKRLSKNNNIQWIIPNNPLYKVLNLPIKSNNLKNNIEILNKATPDMIRIMCDFYHVSLTDKLFWNNDPKIRIYQDWIDLHSIPNKTLSDTLYTQLPKEIQEQKISTITFIYFPTILTDNIYKQLCNLIQKNNIYIYCLPKEKNNDYTYKNHIKNFLLYNSAIMANTVNRPCYMNLMGTELLPICLEEEINFTEIYLKEENNDNNN